VDPELDEYDPQTGGLVESHTYFIHNSHLGILLHSGLLGYLGFTWLSLAFLLRGFRNWRKIPNARMRAVVLGFTLVYLAVLIAAGANSVFAHWSWVPVLGIMMGMNEVILQQGRAG
jgi:O-antigen ligase